MNKKLTALLLTSAMVVTQNLNIASAQEIANVKKYSIDINDDIRVEYNGDDNGLFENGFKTGFGSAITFKGFNENNEPEFYALTDRGPNADAPNYQDGDEVYPSKFFPSATFTPSIGILTLKEDGAVINSAIKIKDSLGNDITGLPLEPGQVGSTGEIALDMNLNNLGYDNNGIDSEGISVDKDGNFWICDEYGPFLVKLDSEGKVLEKYEPGDGLADVLKYRIPNRGFEGLTITPSGKILVSMQSVLNVEGETKSSALFTRIVEFDPETKESKMYAYPVNTEDYNSPKDCKIGDIYAVDDNTILVIEQGKDKDGNMQNYIYKVDLSKATDITDITYEDKELEYVEDKSLIEDVNFAEKELLVDLRENGWTTEKAEGITMLPDKKTIAIINDNDFEIAVSATDEEGNDVSITDYTYDADTKKLSVDDKESNLNISLVKNQEESELWTIELKDEITGSSSNSSSDVSDNEAVEKNSNNIMIVSVIGVVVAGALVYFFKKRKK